jgi:hypothetical protein
MTRELDVDVSELVGVASVPSSRWRELAACRGMTTEAFFAEIPGVEVQEACARCGVRLACLADEVRTPTDDVHGFRGGLPADERRSLLTAVARRLPAKARPAIAAAEQAFEAGAGPAAVASRFGVSMRTACRWRSGAERRAG